MKIFVTVKYLFNIYYRVLGWMNMEHAVCCMLYAVRSVIMIYEVKKKMFLKNVASNKLHWEAAVERSVLQSPFLKLDPLAFRPTIQVSQTGPCFWLLFCSTNDTVLLWRWRAVWLYFLRYLKGLKFNRLRKRVKTRYKRSEGPPIEILSFTIFRVVIVHRRSLWSGKRESSQEEERN